MHALQIKSPNCPEVVTLPTPSLSADNVLIRVVASGICGTDIHIFRGEYTGEYPVIPGHEFAGIVEATGEHVSRFQVGDHVAVEPNICCDNCRFCLSNQQNFCEHWQAVGVTRPGGMAEFVTVPEKNTFPIGTLPFEIGAFMEPLSCVIHGVERIDVQLADHVLLLGAGPIGLLFLQLLRLHGARAVTVLERQAARLQLAEQFAVTELISDFHNVAENRYDVVIDATGDTTLMASSINWVRPGGKVLWFGVPPATSSLTFQPQRVFQKGLTIMSTFTSVRNSLQAIHLLQAGHVNVLPLISHHLKLSEFEKGIRMIEQGTDAVLKIIILPGED